MKKIDFSLAIGMIITLLIGNFNAFANDCGKLEESILRLHIIANSNSNIDQEVKLKVRDAVLNEMSDKLKGETLNESLLLAEENLGEIEEIANNVLKENGLNYNATASITEMYFDTRHYENYTTPAGIYKAVRIVLGNGEGKNWWCVLYPSLCLGSAIEENETLEICENKTAQKPEYIAKFKIIELFEGAKNYLNCIFKNT